jgi:hypothetical protein
MCNFKTDTNNSYVLYIYICVIDWLIDFIPLDPVQV